MVHGDDSDDGGDNNTSSGDSASLSDFASNVWHQQVVRTLWLYMLSLYWFSDDIRIIFLRR